MSASYKNLIATWGTALVSASSRVGCAGPATSGARALGGVSLALSRLNLLTPQQKQTRGLEAEVRVGVRGVC